MTAPVEDLYFLATLNGYAPQEFSTLQGAMAWAQEHDNPTGTIAYVIDKEPGVVVVTYADGEVNTQVGDVSE